MHQAEHVLKVGLRRLGLVSASVVRVPVHLRSHLIDGPERILDGFALVQQPSPRAGGRQAFFLLLRLRDKLLKILIHCQFYFLFD